MLYHKCQILVLKGYMESITHMPEYTDIADLALN